MADLVVDASVASGWCFPDEQTEYTNGVLLAVSDSLEAFARRLWAYEVRNSILMGLRRGRINQADAASFLESLADLNGHLTDPLSYDAILKLAEFSGLTVCDAAYLDLAIREGSQLASLDDHCGKRHSVPESSCPISQELPRQVHQYFLDPPQITTRNRNPVRSCGAILSACRRSLVAKFS